MNYPYSDDYMIYDMRTHRYVLTEKDVLDNLGENLALALNGAGDANDSTLPARFLSRVSATVYNYIYDNSMGVAYLEYMLAKMPELRDLAKEMLEAQVLYTLENGDISNLSGVNVDHGQIMDVDKLRGRVRVAPLVETLANQILPELGHSLKYCGELPCVPREIYRSGY